MAVVGITEYAQEQLGDIVYVELPDVGANVEMGAEAAVVESVKAASEIYAPISGEVSETNTALADVILRPEVSPMLELGRAKGCITQTGHDMARAQAGLIMEHLGLA